MSAYPDPAEQPAILSSPTTNYLSITLPPEKSRRTKGDMTPGGLSLASQSSIATLTSMASDPEGGVPHKAESWWTTALQVSVPFFLAGVGTIGAGNVLGNAQVITANLPKIRSVHIVHINLNQLLIFVDQPLYFRFTMLIFYKKIKSCTNFLCRFTTRIILFAGLQPYCFNFHKKSYFRFSFPHNWTFFH